MNHSGFNGFVTHKNLLKFTKFLQEPKVSQKCPKMQFHLNNVQRTSVYQLFLSLFLFCPSASTAHISLVSVSIGHQTSKNILSIVDCFVHKAMALI